jgi:hypothetical protein
LILLRLTLLGSRSPGTDRQVSAGISAPFRSWRHHGPRGKRANARAA